MKNSTVTESLVGPDKVMDVRLIPCSIKHGLIIKQWLELPVGDHFILLNDHDPVPLYYQFAAQWPNAFTLAASGQRAGGIPGKNHEAEIHRTGR